VPGVPFYVMYGATEASARLSFLEPTELDRRLGSIGRAIPNVELKVITEDGREAAVGEVGEIVARGSNISAGYWNAPDETRDAFGPHGYRTGDLARTDEEGYLFIVGRSRDMIKVGAHRVGTKEIEDLLHEHPSVYEAAVVGGPDPLLGEVPVAFITPRDGLPILPATLAEFCRGRLADYKVPTRFILRSELPKSGAGKIDKNALRASLAGETAGGPA
jgi:acyl-CoA synthetase (AMP-forming)/AMP-acid ligase II